jgi:t-SNARE complex subunit (syntaxin)
MDLQQILDKNNIYYVENIDNNDNNDNTNKDYTVDNLYNDVKDINDIYKNIDEILNCHNQLIDTIEDNLSLANLEIIDSTNEIKKADEYFASYKTYQYVLYGIAFVATAMILI